MAKPLKGSGMIKSLRLKNFKCYRDTGEVRFAPITVIVGCNNSGKSSLLQSLLLLKQTIQAPSRRPRLVTRGPIVDSGTFRDILHGRPEEGKERLGIEITRDGYLRYQAADSHEDKLQLAFRLDHKSGRIRISTDRFYIGGRFFFSVKDSGKLLDYPRSKRPDTLGRIETRMINFLPIASIKDPNIRPRSLKSREEIVSTVNLISMLSQDWRDFFLNITHIGTTRSVIPFYWGVGESTGSVESQFLQQLASDEPLSMTRKTLRDSLNEWLSGEFKTLSNLHLQPLDTAKQIHSVMAHNSGSDIPVNVAAMGEGISQIIPIMSTIFMSRPREMLLIERPETGLHPAMQADLGEFFARMAVEFRRQIVIETHSEHLLLRIRRLVAEGRIKADDVSILYVEREASESKVLQLELTERGQIPNWPKGFFADAYDEALALATAKRKS